MSQIDSPVVPVVQLGSHSLGCVIKHVLSKLCLLECDVLAVHMLVCGLALGRH